MVMVMFILSLLLSAVFGIVQGTVQLTDDMTVEQEKDARQRGFTQFCERTLRSLPAQATVRLRVKQSGNRYLSQLALKDAPVSFSINGTGASGLTILETEEATDGYLRVMLRWLTNEEAAAWERGDSSAGGRRLLLLENVAVCEWRFFNPRSNEWENVWNDKLSFAQTVDPLSSLAGAAPLPSPGAQGQRPGLIELRLGIGNEEPQKWILWVPPGQAPATNFTPSATPNTNQNPNPPPEN
jgi:hypothetical protein